MKTETRQKILRAIQTIYAHGYGKGSSDADCERDFDPRGSASEYIDTEPYVVRALLEAEEESGASDSELAVKAIDVIRSAREYMPVGAAKRTERTISLLLAAIPASTWAAPEPEPEEGEPETEMESLRESIESRKIVEEYLASETDEVRNTLSERIEALERADPPHMTAWGRTVTDALAELREKMEALEERLDRVAATAFDLPPGYSIDWSTEPDSEPEPGVREFYPTSTPGKPEVRVRREPERDEGGEDRLSIHDDEVLPEEKEEGRALVELIVRLHDGGWQVCSKDFAALMVGKELARVRLRSRPSEELVGPGTSHVFDNVTSAFWRAFDAGRSGDREAMYRERDRWLDWFESLRTKEGDDEA